jgi:hypothetical protein
LAWLTLVPTRLLAHFKPISMATEDHYQVRIRSERGTGLQRVCFWPPPQITSKSGAPAALGDIKTLAALTHAHLPSPALTHRRPLDQSTPAARVHFWPLVSAAAMGSHGGVVSGLQRIGW